MAFGVLVHETGHKSFFTSQSVNNFVATWLSGYWVFSDKDAYMKGHLVHHRDCGTVDDPDSIVIVEGTPPCPADLTGDGEVNGADLGLMIAFWGTPGGDLTGDKTTDGADLGLLIASWGACPN